MIRKLKNWYLNTFHYEQTEEYKKAEADYLNFESDKFKRFADALNEMYGRLNAELKIDVEKLEASCKEARKKNEEIKRSTLFKQSNKEEVKK
jgi:hypothetical protein